MYFYHLLAANGLADLCLRGGVGDRHDICNSCGTWKTNAIHTLTGCDQQIWHENCWHQGRACSVLEGLWEGTYGCAGLHAEWWYKCWTEGTMALKRWMVYILAGTTQKVNDNQLCYRRSYSEVHSMQPTCKKIAWETFHWTRKTMGLLWKVNISSQRNAIVICQMYCLWNVVVWNVPLDLVLVEKETSAAAYSVNAGKTVSATNAKTLMVLFWQSRCGSYKHREWEKWC